MRVELNQVSASPDGVAQPGEVVDLPKKEAEALIASGQARTPRKRVLREVPVDEDEQGDETATRTAPERATGRRSRRGAQEGADAED